MPQISFKYSMLVLNRRYYDEYFFNLANKCSSYNINIIYDPARPKWIKHLSGSCLVFTQDYYSDGLGYTRLTNDHIRKIQNHDRPVYIVTTVYNASMDQKIKNLQWLHCGPEMLFQQQQYPALLNARIKYWKGEHSICLGLLPRPHRLATACLLLGNNINAQSVKVNAAPHNNHSFNDYWPCTVEFSDILEKGWKRLLTQDLGKPAERYNVSANNNTMNFNINLRNIYENTCVEIVMETTFFNSGVFVSEKYLNSIYGYNFPIIIGNCGTVDYLRRNGFDMFDDIIDHSYDSITDPLQRIYTAISKNIEIIKNKQTAVDLWYKNLDRLDNNLNFAKHHMYTHFESQFLDSLNKLMCNATSFA